MVVNLLEKVSFFFFFGVGNLFEKVRVSFCFEREDGDGFV